MIDIVDQIDFSLSTWIRTNLHNPRLNRILSKINRGEVFLLILLPFLYLKNDLPIVWYWVLLFTGLVTYTNDRFVLFLKKLIARKRPLITVAGKVDSNPDMKHSFPSAHAANSMTAVLILVLLFKFSPALILISFFSRSRKVTFSSSLCERRDRWLDDRNYFRFFWFISWKRSS